MTALLCLAFFLSGVSALLFETLWFRQAGLALGNSIWASSLVLAGFMAGLALGNAIAGRVGHRVLRPMRLYALLEVAVGIAGVSLVFLLPALGHWLAPLLRPFLDVPALLNLLRLGIAFALLLVPSTAMGATLPLLVGALSRRDRRFGRVLGLLYGWNTLGAVVGAVAGEMVLLAWLGVRGTGFAAAAANVVAALIAFALASSLDRAGRAGSEEPREVEKVKKVKNVPGVLGGAALAGGILLALEVVWFRFLILFMLPDALAFSLMLAVVLAGIGAGGLAASGWLARRSAARGALPWLFAAIGVLTFGTYALFDLVIRPFAMRVVFTELGMLALALPLMLPVSLLSGVLFTFLGEVLQRESPGETRAAGYLAFANTAGAAVGSLAGGFVLLPLLGIERSLQLLAAAYLLAALLTARRPLPRAGVLWASAVALCIVAALVPCGLMENRFLPIPANRIARREGSTLEAAREGLTETILYLRKDVYGETRYHRLVTNSHGMSSNEARARRYMKLFVYFPIAVHPAPRNALLISYGVGVTARALTDTAELERIDVVDTSRDILEMSRIVHPDSAHPLDDPRVRVHIEDGRYFLQTTDERFDLITAEPPPPKAAGIVNLYTREYFALLRERLADGGIATYWLPVHSLLEHETKAIIRAFCEAFPDCSLWAGADFNWNLVGTRDAVGVSAERFRRQWDDPVVGPDLRALGFERPEQFGALFLAGADDLLERTVDTPPLTDDRPKRLGRIPTRSHRLRPVYLPWMKVRPARERFLESEIVRRLWPEPLVRQSLLWFETQRLLNDFVLRDRRSPAHELGIAHRLLVFTTLSTLPLWYLDRNADTQRAADLAHRDGRSGPGIETELGIGALTRREWDAAAEHFRRAGSYDAVPREASWYRVYALCMADRRDEAMRVAVGARLPNATDPADAEMWRLLAREFDLPGPRAPEGRAQ